VQGVVGRVLVAKLLGAECVSFVWYLGVVRGAALVSPALQALPFVAFGAERILVLVVVCCLCIGFLLHYLISFALVVLCICFHFAF